MKYIIYPTMWFIGNLISSIFILLVIIIKPILSTIWYFKINNNCILPKYYATMDNILVRANEVGKYTTIFHFLWSIKNFKNTLKSI